MSVWLPEDIIDVAEASWHVCCIFICAASLQSAVARTGRLAPQTVSARGKSLSCACTSAAECTVQTQAQTQAHRLQPASNQQDIELGELGAEWLAGSDTSPSSLNCKSAQDADDALLTCDVDIPAMKLAHMPLDVSAQQNTLQCKLKQMSCNHQVVLLCSLTLPLSGK